MSFSLDQWKSSTKKGFLKPTQYEVTVNPPTGGGRELRLLTESITSPGISFLTADGHRPYGSGKTYDIAYSYNTSEISCTHLIDKDGDAYKILYEWANLVSNINGDKNWHASYFDEYAKNDMEISIFGYDFTDLVKTVKLYNAYPKSVDPIQLSWGDADNIARVSVTYYYLYFTIS
jgi:hypothetical protein